LTLWILGEYGGWMPAAKKSEKRRQTSPLQIRMEAEERAYLEAGARKKEEGSPSKVGLGPFIKWAGMQETERLLGVSFADFQAGAGQKRGKGSGR
jgi:hypothetical protein